MKLFRNRNDKKRNKLTTLFNSVNNYQTLNLDAPMERFVKEMDENEFISKRAKIEPTPDERPIGEVLESEHVKEKEAFKQDLQETGTMDLSQVGKNNTVNKIKKLFGNKNTPIAGINPQQVQQTVPIAGMNTQIPIQQAPIKDTNPEQQIAIEKLQSELFALKDKNQFFSDRMGKISEDIGELRSMQFQRDRQFGDIQAAAEKASQITDLIDPQRIQKILEQRKKEIEELWDKFERAEEISKRSEQELTGIRDAINQITSMKNLLKETENLTKIARKAKTFNEESRSYAERSQSAFIEIQNMVTDVSELRAQIETNKDISRDNTKKVDGLSLKVENTPTESDMNKLRGAVNKLIRQEEMVNDLDDEIKKVKEQVDNILTIKEPQESNIDIKNKNSEIEALEAQKKQISFLLADLKNDYSEHMITDSAYAEAKQMSELRINQIDKQISLLKIDKEKSLEKEQYKKKLTNTPTRTITPTNIQQQNNLQMIKNSVSAPVEQPKTVENTQKELEKVEQAKRARIERPEDDAKKEIKPNTLATETPTTHISNNTPTTEQSKSDGTSAVSKDKSDGTSAVSKDELDLSDLDENNASNDDVGDLDDLNLDSEENADKTTENSNTSEQVKDDLNIDNIDKTEPENKQTEQKPNSEESAPKEKESEESKATFSETGEDKTKSDTNTTNTTDLEDADINKLRKHRDKYDKFLEQLEQQYEEDIITESEYYTAQNKTMSKIKEINDALTKKLSTN
jgi:hypothetical protein